MTRDRGDDDLRAASLGRLVDELLDGKAAPPALAAEDRAFLETAALIRAAYSAPAPSERHAHAEAPPSPRRLARLAPWAVAVLAAAAAVIFAVVAVRPPAADHLPSELRSRSVDRLVGRIEPGSSATRRADLVYADRLMSYRQLGQRSAQGRP